MECSKALNDLRPLRRTRSLPVMKPVLYSPSPSFTAVSSATRSREQEAVFFSLWLRQMGGRCTAEETPENGYSDEPTDRHPTRERGSSFSLDASLSSTEPSVGPKESRTPTRKTSTSSASHPSLSLLAHKEKETSSTRRQTLSIERSRRSSGAPPPSVNAWVGHESTTSDTTRPEREGVPSVTPFLRSEVEKRTTTKKGKAESPDLSTPMKDPERRSMDEGVVRDPLACTAALKERSVVDHIGGHVPKTEAMAMHNDVKKTEKTTTGLPFDAMKVPKEAVMVSSPPVLRSSSSGAPSLAIEEAQRDTTHPSHTSSPLVQNPASRAVWSVKQRSRLWALRWHDCVTSLPTGVRDFVTHDMPALLAAASAAASPRATSSSTTRNANFPWQRWSTSRHSSQSGAGNGGGGVGMAAAGRLATTTSGSGVYYRGTSGSTHLFLDAKKHTLGRMLRSSEEGRGMTEKEGECGEGKEERRDTEGLDGGIGATLPTSLGAGGGGKTGSSDGRFARRPSRTGGSDDPHGKEESPPHYVSEDTAEGQCLDDATCPPPSHRTPETTTSTTEAKNEHEKNSMGESRREEVPKRTSTAAGASGAGVKASVNPIFLAMEKWGESHAASSIPLAPSRRHRGLFGAVKEKQLHQLVVAVLNKVSDDTEKFREVRTELMNLPVPEAGPEELSQVLQAFLRKAISEPRFSKLYAGLMKCVCLRPPTSASTMDSRLSISCSPPFPSMPSTLSVSSPASSCSIPCSSVPSSTGSPCGLTLSAAASSAVPRMASDSSTCSRSSSTSTNNMNTTTTTTRTSTTPTPMRRMLHDLPDDNSAAAGEVPVNAPLPSSTSSPLSPAAVQVEAPPPPPEVPPTVKEEDTAFPLSPISMTERVGQGIVQLCLETFRSLLTGGEEVGGGSEENTKREDETRAALSLPSSCSPASLSSHSVLPTVLTTSTTTDSMVPISIPKPTLSPSLSLSSPVSSFTPSLSSFSALPTPTTSDPENHEPLKVDPPESLYEKHHLSSSSSSSRRTEDSTVVSAPYPMSEERKKMMRDQLCGTVRFAVELHHISFIGDEDLTNILWMCCTGKTVAEAGKESGKDAWMQTNTAASPADVHSALPSRCFPSSHRWPAPLVPSESYVPTEAQMSALLTLLASSSHSPFFHSAVWRQRLLPDLVPWLSFWQQHYPVPRIRFLLISEREKTQQQWEYVQRDLYHQDGVHPKEHVVPLPFRTSSSSSSSSSSSFSSSSCVRVGPHPSPSHPSYSFVVTHRVPSSGGAPFFSRGGEGVAVAEAASLSSPVPRPSSSSASGYPTHLSPPLPLPTTTTTAVVPEKEEASSGTLVPLPIPSPSMDPADVAFFPAYSNDLALLMKNCEDRVWQLEAVVEHCFHDWMPHVVQESVPPAPPSSASPLPSAVDLAEGVRQVRQLVHQWVHRGLHVVRESWSREHTGKLLHLLRRGATQGPMAHLLTREVLAEEVQRTMRRCFDDGLYEYHPRFFSFFAAMVLSDTTEEVMNANWLNEGLLWLMEREAKEGATTAEDDEEGEEGEAAGDRRSMDPDWSSFPLLSPARLRTVETYLVEVGKVYQASRVGWKGRQKISPLGDGGMPTGAWEKDDVLPPPPLSHTWCDHSPKEHAGFHESALESRRMESTSQSCVWKGLCHAGWTPFHVLFPPSLVSPRFRPLLALFVGCAAVWQVLPKGPSSREKEGEEGQAAWEGKRRLLWALLAPPCSFFPPFPPVPLSSSSSSFSFSSSSLADAHPIGDATTPSASCPPFAMGMGCVWRQLSSSGRQQLTTSFVECHVFDILSHVFSLPAGGEEKESSDDASPPPPPPPLSSVGWHALSAPPPSEISQTAANANAEEGTFFSLPLSPVRFHLAAEAIFHVVRDEMGKRSEQFFSSASASDGVWQEEGEDVVGGMKESDSLACEVLSAVLFAAYTLPLGSRTNRSRRNRASSVHGVCTPPPPPTAASTAPPSCTSSFLPPWRSFPWHMLIPSLLPAFHVAVDSCMGDRKACEREMMDETRLVLSCMAVFGTESEAWWSSMAALSRSAAPPPPLPSSSPSPPPPPSTPSLAWVPYFASFRMQVMESCQEVGHLLCAKEVLSDETLHWWQEHTALPHGVMYDRERRYTGVGRGGEGVGEGIAGGGRPPTFSVHASMTSIASASSFSPDPKPDLLSAPCVRSPSSSAFPMHQTPRGGQRTSPPFFPSRLPLPLPPSPTVTTKGMTVGVPSPPSPFHATPDSSSLSVEGNGERSRGGWRTPGDSVCGYPRGRPSASPSKPEAEAEVPLPIASPTPFRPPSLDHAASGKWDQGVRSHANTTAVSQAHANDSSMPHASTSRMGGMSHTGPGTPRTLRPPSRRWGGTDPSLYASTAFPASHPPRPFSSSSSPPQRLSPSMGHPYPSPFPSSSPSKYHSFPSHSGDLQGGLPFSSSPLARPDATTGPPPHWDAHSAAVTASPFIPSSCQLPPSGAVTPLPTSSVTPPVPWGGRGGRGRRGGNTTGTPVNGKGRAHREGER